MLARGLVPFPLAEQPARAAEALRLDPDRKRTPALATEGPSRLPGNPRNTTRPSPGARIPRTSACRSSGHNLWRPHPHGPHTSWQSPRKDGDAKMPGPRRQLLGEHLDLAGYVVGAVL